MVECVGRLWSKAICRNSIPLTKESPEGFMDHTLALIGIIASAWTYFFIIENIEEIRMHRLMDRRVAGEICPPVRRSFLRRRRNGPGAGRRGLAAQEKARSA
jgi:hypothetical protein